MDDESLRTDELIDDLATEASHPVGDRRESTLPSPPQSPPLSPPRGSTGTSLVSTLAVQRVVAAASARQSLAEDDAEMPRIERKELRPPQASSDGEGTLRFSASSALQLGFAAAAVRLDEASDQAPSAAHERGAAGGRYRDDATQGSSGGPPARQSAVADEVASAVGRGRLAPDARGDDLASERSLDRRGADDAGSEVSDRSALRASGGRDGARRWMPAVAEAEVVGVGAGGPMVLDDSNSSFGMFRHAVEAEARQPAPRAPAAAGCPARPPHQEDERGMMAATSSAGRSSDGRDSQSTSSVYTSCSEGPDGDRMAKVRREREELAITQAGLRRARRCAADGADGVRPAWAMPLPQQDRVWPMLVLSSGALADFRGDVAVGPAAALGVPDAGPGPQVVTDGGRCCARALVIAEGRSFVAAPPPELQQSKIKLEKFYHEVLAAVRDHEPSARSVCIAVLPSPPLRGRVALRDVADVAIVAMLTFQFSGFGELRQLHLLAGSDAEAQDMAAIASRVWVERRVAEAMCNDPDAGAGAGRRSVLALLTGPTPDTEELDMVVLEQAIAAVERTYDDPGRLAAEWSAQLAAALVRLTGRSDRLKRVLVSGHGWVRGAAFSEPPDRPRLLGDLGRQLRLLSGGGHGESGGHSGELQRPSFWRRMCRCFAPRQAQPPVWARLRDDDGEFDARAAMEQVSEAWEKESQHLRSKFTEDMERLFKKQLADAALKDKQASTSLLGTVEDKLAAHDARHEKLLDRRPAWAEELLVDLRRGTQQAPEWGKDLLREQARLHGSLEGCAAELSSVQNLQKEMPHVLGQHLTRILPELLEQHGENHREGSKEGSDEADGRLDKALGNQMRNQAKRLKRLAQRMGDMTDDHGAANEDIARRLEDIFDLVAQLQAQQLKPKGKKSKKSRPPEETGETGSGSFDDDRDQGGYASPDFGLALEGDGLTLEGDGGFPEEQEEQQDEQQGEWDAGNDFTGNNWDAVESEAELVPLEQGPPLPEKEKKKSKRRKHRG